MTGLTYTDGEVAKRGRLGVRRQLAIQSGTFFDWVAMGSLLWIIVGAGLDGNAHFHGLVDNSFFTPYHFVLYSGLLAAMLVHFGAVAVNMRGGCELKRAIPSGYEWAVIGVCVAIGGGVLDLIWHTVFGIEASIESLFSPSHTILLAGIVLIFSGPFRSLWDRSVNGAVVSWRQGFPAVMSLAVIVSVLTVYFDYLSPFGGAWASSRYAALATMAFTNWPSWPPAEFAIAIGATAFMVTGAFVVGLVVVTNRRLKLPFGAWTLILTLSALIVGAFYDEMRSVMVTVIGGIIIDLVAYRSFRVGMWRPVYYRAAFGLPVVLFSVYFVVLGLTGGVWWKFHVVSGVIVMSGLAGVMIAFLLRSSYVTAVLPSEMNDASQHE